VISLRSIISAKAESYPEVNIQVPAATKFAVPNLEGDGHLVVGMELFVEAFFRMRFELDIVGRGKANKGQQ
jgi:hypothetical protein